MNEDIKYQIKREFEEIWKAQEENPPTHEVAGIELLSFLFSSIEKVLAEKWQKE